MGQQGQQGGTIMGQQGGQGGTVQHAMGGGGVGMGIGGGDQHLRSSGMFSASDDAATGTTIHALLMLVDHVDPDVRKYALLKLRDHLPIWRIPVDRQFAGTSQEAHFPQIHMEDMLQQQQQQQQQQGMHHGSHQHLMQQVRVWGVGHRHTTRGHTLSMFDSCLVPPHAIPTSPIVLLGCERERERENGRERPT